MVQLSIIKQRKGPCKHATDWGEVVVKLCLIFSVAIFAGCSPSSREKTTMVMCLSTLQSVDIQFRREWSHGATNQSLSDCLSRVFASHGSNIFRCPLQQGIYEINPYVRKWNSSELFSGEIAVFCNSPHYKRKTNYVYAGVSFDGSLLKMSAKPGWATNTVLNRQL